MKKLFTSIAISFAFVTAALAQTISAFGDSQTEQTYYTNSSLRWVPKLSATLGQSISNYAHGGDQVGDQLPYFIARPLPGATDTSLIWLGTNHQKQGVNSTKQGYFKDALRAVILQRALANKQAAASYGAETGSWVGTGLWPSFGKASTAIGSTKTFTVTGSAVFLSVLVIDTGGDTGTYEVRIDGGAAQSFNAVAAGITSPNGYPYSERAHRWGGLASGSHTIEVKHTGGAKLYVQWAAGSTQTVNPKVYVGNIPRATAAGYAAVGGSVPNTQSYNVDIADLVAESVADGRQVFLVDLYNSLNDTTDLTQSSNCTSPCSPDGFHISDAGSTKVAAAFYSAMTGGSPPPTVTYSPLYKGSDGLYYTDAMGAKVPTTVPYKGNHKRNPGQRQHHNRRSRCNIGQRVRCRQLAVR